MSKAPEEPPVLINFLYKDTSLAKSFYAQIYSGFITEFQKKEDELEEKISLKHWQFGPRFLRSLGGEEGKEQVKASYTEIIDPHDTAYLDLLHLLSRYAVTDLESAGHGSIVAIQGNLLILSRSLWQIGAEAFLAMLESQPKEFGMTKREVKALSKLLNKIFSSPHFSSRYFLINEGCTVAGYLNENYLSEPLDALIFKYGDKLIPNIILVGLKEEPKRYDLMQIFPEQNIEHGILTALKELSGLTYKAQYLIKPLFMYYISPLLRKETTDLTKPSRNS